MSTILETGYGRLRGERVPSPAQDAESGGVQVFRGIPFARAPIGKLRFAPPARPEPWSGVRDATRFAPAALQNPDQIGSLLGFDGIGEISEDCLSLNVWTPGLDGGRRPVMVWIHGGAFVIGSSSQTMYDGATLARRGDVVVVSVNYRLGAFGFLHLGDLAGAAGRASAELPSNLGILDQIAALEWVRAEIARFGGDPENVTVFGESAGAISVATLLGTPRARGLFRRAILQSGSANVVTSRESAGEVARALLGELGLPADESAVARLRGLPAADVVAAQQRVVLAGWSQMNGTPFQPVVDGEVLPVSTFASLAEGQARDVEILAGTTLDEWKLFVLIDPAFAKLDEAGLVRRCERSLPGAGRDGTSRGRRAIEVYRRARAQRGADTSPREIWCALESDRVFRAPAMRLVELASAHQPKTFAYLFDWQSPVLEGVLGACHVLDVPFVFGTLDDPRLATFTGTGEAVTRLATQIQDAWTAFARDGDPSHAGLGQWPAYEPGRRATMVLGRDCHLADAPLEDERRFWAESD
ncbi:MAG TPA: carboxylesterase/lipase family protein [Candidatus Bathyarchaeia archaeon]|nr:carboxylesterase/lipase family protein [Candidatus Bathyarchaeia archaeon]